MGGGLPPNCTGRGIADVRQGPLGVPRPPKESPRLSQDDPRPSQDDPKTAQDSLKTAPRRSDRPRRLLERLF